MPTLSLLDGTRASNPVEANITAPKTFSASAARVVDALKSIWPKKTAANVAYISGVSERTVHFWLAGQTRMPMEAIAALLRTDAGYEILKAVLGDDCKADWWQLAQLTHDIRESQNAITKEQERIAVTAARLEQIGRFERVEVPS